jgi:hypothetical protein
MVRRKDGFSMKSWSLAVVMLLVIACEPREELFPVPHYMYERFETNEPCPEVSYFRLHFPDSTVVVADTMSGFRIYDGAGIGTPNGMSADLSWCSSRCDSINVVLALMDKEPIENRFFFAVPGSYKFYNIYEPDYEKKKQLGGVTVGYRPSLSKGVLVSVLGSEYFYVKGLHGDDRQTRLCGEFDVLLCRDDSVRVTGDYSLLFTNYNPR